MLEDRQRNNSPELLIKKQIFSLFLLCNAVARQRRAWGFHYPPAPFGYHLTQPATA
jgi:hypothetical protein